MGKISNYRNINTLYCEARQTALDIIIGEAIKVMENHPVYTEFFLGLGDCYFKSGDVVITMEDMPCCAEEIKEVLGDWDDRLCLTSEGIYVYPDGKIIEM